MDNVDPKTVKGFGQEWSYYTQKKMSNDESIKLFLDYFKIFPFETLNKTSVGLDVGCGSGRWARHIAPKIDRLYCLDASAEALNVAKQTLKNQDNVQFINASVNNIPLPDSSMDFAYSLGVLHHIPDTFEGIKACAKKLKKGAPFLVYLYYAFDNKPHWYSVIWKISDLFRRLISKFPFKIKLACTKMIAISIYYPLARFALIAEKFNFNVENWLLSSYRHSSLYTMYTDSLDRFGTQLEHRFTKNEINVMLEKAGFTQIQFSNETPYWCAIGYKAE